MPKKFDRELSALKEKVVEMGGLAQQMCATVLSAVNDRDRTLLPRVYELEERVDQFQIDIDDDVTRLMAVYGPVALDLRFVLMVARINTELERIGDQAVNMCENAELLVTEPALDQQGRHLPGMAETVGRMVSQSLRAFRDGQVDVAREVISSDNTVDSINNRIFRDLLEQMTVDTGTVKRALALLLTARALERIADHATNIAEEVIFLVKAKDVRHQSDPA
jgi:phosphate transport system protein